MIESRDRELQLKTYGELIQPVFKMKPIDIDMEIESFFQNLIISQGSSEYYKKNIYCTNIDQFCFEYDYQIEGLMSLGCSQHVKIMFENLNVPEKKSFRYITRMMNRHHNISKVNRVYYFTNF